MLRSRNRSARAGPVCQAGRVIGPLTLDPDDGLAALDEVCAAFTAFLDSQDDLIDVLRRLSVLDDMAVPGLLARADQVRAAIADFRCRLRRSHVPSPGDEGNGPAAVQDG